MPQFACHHLPLDLETHHEEEDGHENVVHELHQGERVTVGVQRDDLTDRKVDLGVPEVVIGAGPWRVGPDEGHDRGNHEQYSARGFVAEEARHGPSDGARQGSVAAQPREASI